MARLAELNSGRRAEAAPRKPFSSARGPKRPATYPDAEKPQRVGVYPPVCHLGWHC